jgi:hypothetical protein
MVVSNTPFNNYHDIRTIFFCQIFENLFITCVKILIKLRINKISIVRFELQTVQDLRLRQFKHIRLSNNLE